MKKFLLLTGCSLLLSTFIAAQDSTALQNPSSFGLNGEEPLIVIKGESLRRFPSGNFLDAVNGLFPWVFSQKANANSFLFVVNGFLLPDINGISLNDIEEVSFSVSSLQGQLFPFSKPGTFYITTRKYAGCKASFNFNSQYNVIWNKNYASVVPIAGGSNQMQTLKYDAAHLLTNHLSVLTGGKKWSLYASAQIDQLTTPKLTYTYNTLKDTTIRNTLPKQLNLRSFAQFTYRVSSRLHFALTGSYFHGTTNSDTTLLGLYNTYSPGRENSATTVKTTLPYYHAGFSGYWAPLRKLRNNVSVEYGSDMLNYDFKNVDTSYGANFNLSNHSAENTIMHSKRLLVRDELTYNFATTSTFFSGIFVNFSYLHQHLDFSNSFYTISSNGASSSHSNSFFSTQKITTLNPGYYFSWHSILSGYAGYAFILNKGLSNYISSAKSNPYAGILLSIKNLLKTGGYLNRLDLAVDYGYLNENNSNNNWLPGIEKPAQFSPASVATVAESQSGTSALPNLALLKNKLMTFSVNAAFFNNRLLTGAAYSERNTDSLYAQYQYYLNFTYYANATEKQKSFAVFAAVRIIDQPLKTWTARFNVLLLPHAKYTIDNAPFSLITSLKDQAEVGLQHSFTIKNWYAQINGLMALNNKVVNTWLLNYLLIGYNFSGTSGRVLRKVNVFAQARNLLSSRAAKDYFGYYTYAGAGLNLAF